MVVAYLLKDEESKRDELVALAQRDDWFAPIASRVVQQRTPISFRYWGRIGRYVPEQPSVDDRGGFCFSSRFGRAAVAHCWLHELMHEWQCQMGLLWTPEQSDAVHRDSAMCIVLFCEAMAETEAIRASWRLKEQGDPVAWKGGLQSPDWRYQARAYGSSLQAGVREKDAALVCFVQCCQSHAAYYAQHVQRASVEGGGARVALSEWLERASVDCWPDWLANVPWSAMERIVNAAIERMNG